MPGDTYLSSTLLIDRSGLVHLLPLLGDLTLGVNPGVVRTESDLPESDLPGEEDQSLHLVVGTTHPARIAVVTGTVTVTVTTTGATAIGLEARTIGIGK